VFGSVGGGETKVKTEDGRAHGCVSQCGLGAWGGTDLPRRLTWARNGTACCHLIGREAHGSWMCDEVPSRFARLPSPRAKPRGLAVIRRR
jgi:hypothetical protein